MLLGFDIMIEEKKVMEKVNGNDFARNVAIFDVDDRLSFHTYNKKNKFLVSSEILTDGINDNIGTAEKKISI